MFSGHQAPPLSPRPTLLLRDKAPVVGRGPRRWCNRLLWLRLHQDGRRSPGLCRSPRVEPGRPWRTSWSVSWSKCRC